MIGVSFRHCQGWYHPAPSRRAVLICGAHGFEDLCARRGLRQLAEALAVAGLPVLRFDWPGSGDSAGEETDADLVPRWRESVKDAARFLAEEAGVTEVVLVGLRLGALLAAIEAPAIEASAGVKLAGLALLAPTASGRAYLREMTVLGGIMRPVGLQESDLPGPGVCDVCGFRILPPTADALKPLALATAAPLPAVPVLLMPQKGNDVRALVARYGEAGCALTVAPFEGYESMICDPTASVVPEAAYEAVAGWVTTMPDRPAGSSRPVSASALEGDGWVETGVTFGAYGGMAGIVCRPAAGVSPGVDPVVLVNSGMNHHVGWGRMTVRQARALACAGIPSLRYDTAGIGDSRPEQAELPLYDATAQRGLTLAVDTMIDAFGGKPTVYGACSGAYTALHGALADERIGRIVIANLMTFRWTPELGFEVSNFGTVRRTEVAADLAGLDPGRLGWRVVLARLDYQRVRIQRALGRRWTRWRHGRAAAGEDIAAWFRRLSERAMKVAVIYADGDPGVARLEEVAGPGGKALTRLPGVSVTMLEHADHSLTPRRAQDAILTTLLDVARPPASAVGPAVVDGASRLPLSARPVRRSRHDVAVWVC